jgi:hypothetical protein
MKKWKDRSAGVVFGQFFTEMLKELKGLTHQLQIIPPNCIL